MGGVIDYGSGKGRILYNAIKLGFNSAIGVEFAKELFNTSKENLKKLLNQKEYEKVQIILDDASNISPNKDTRLIFFYNPFDEIIMSKVINNIINTKYEKLPYIAYVNPNLREMFIQNNNFEMVSTHICSKSGDIVDIYRLKNNN